MREAELFKFSLRDLSRGAQDGKAAGVESGIKGALLRLVPIHASTRHVPSLGLQVGCAEAKIKAPRVEKDQTREQGSQTREGWVIAGEVAPVGSLVGMSALVPADHQEAIAATGAHGHTGCSWEEECGQILTLL